MYKTMSIEKLREDVESKGYILTPSEVAELKKDPRKGVQDIVTRVERLVEKLRAEETRLYAITETERDLWARGYTRVLGMDEVGRGPLAGPVTVAGVILAPYSSIAGVNDSKVMTPRSRQDVSQLIKTNALAWAIACRNNDYIDQHGIIPAIKACQLEIIEQLSPDYLLLDAFSLPECPLPQLAIVHGDSKSMSIGAASIIAKVFRDRLMVELDSTYPGYGLASHKGYGCREHYDALFSFGPCAIHRKSYLGFMEQARE